MALGLGATVGLLAGCAAFRTTRATRLGEDTYQIACAKPLQECLGPLDEVCRDGYTVVRGEEKRERRGPTPWVVETFSSEAVVRCRYSKSVFGSGSTEAPPPAPPAASAPAPGAPPPAPACFPGSSQACVRPGGCAGGQVCQADGHAFGPCDCGARGDGGASDAARD